MNDSSTIALSAIAGLVLGAIFFGGLWWTVRRGVESKNSALWFFGSLILRMAIAFAGIYYVGKDDWTRMLACLVGFIVARMVIIRLTRQSCEVGKGADHAS